jgi:small subunit ribosomal protein S16
LLRIRLRRMGKKKQASYRLVVADQNSPRDGAFVEIVGHYNPRTDPATVEIDDDRVKHWLSAGAQPSETVHRLLHTRGLIAVAPPKRQTAPSKAEQAAAAAKAEAEAKAAAEAAAKAKAAADAAAAEAAAAAAPAAPAAE